MTLKSWATLIALAFVVYYANIHNSGLDRSAWHWSMLWVGLIACFYYGSPSREPVSHIDRFTLLAAGLFLLFAAIQIVPLPLKLVEILSPARFDLFRATLPVLGNSSRWLPLSAVPDQTVECLLTLAGYTLVALILRDLTLRVNSRLWLTALPILTIAALEAILSFFQAGGGVAEITATGTYSNRNHFAALLEMLLPFAVTIPLSILQRQPEPCEQRSYPSSTIIQTCVFLSIAAVLFVGILWSQSSIGMILLFTELFIVAITSYSLRGWKVEYEVSAGWSHKWLPSIIVVMVVISSLLILPTDPLLARFSDLAKTEDIPAQTRLQIWRDTTRLIAAFPLFGCGLGGYLSCFLRYKTTASLNTVPYAHNDYLQVLAESGVFGFTFGFLFVFRVLQGAFRGIQYAQSLESRYLAIACTASITTMLLQSLVDFNVYIPANGLVFAWIIGISGIYLRRARVHRFAVNPPAGLLESA